MLYLTEDLLTSVKLRSMVPISQSTFQDADLIQLANEELQLKLVADIMGERENFFLATESKSVYANMDTYPMPSRAIGNALKVVWYVDGQGNKKKLQLKDIDQLGDYSILGGAIPDGYYIQGDSIVLMSPPNTTGGFIRFDFYARPNKLVPTANCAKITSSSASAPNTVFNVDTDLTAALSVGSLVDVVSMASPFLLWGYKVPVVAITSSQITVASAGVSDQNSAVEPVAGDYICPSGQANIAQVPQEFHPVLAQMVANRLLWGLGHMDKFQSGIQTLKEDRENALKLIKNRVEATPERVNTRSGIVSAFTRRF